MREVKYLSYSSFKLFESDPDMFYRRYLSDNRPPREPQNKYMSIGSAFDAFVKADLHTLFVNDGDPKYTRDALFTSQVEEQNRDTARIDGQILYDRYKKCGAWDDLLEDMKGCFSPRFESDVTAELSVTRLEGSVCVLGKPDVNYIHRGGARIIHDFKCQGFYSKNPPSPSKGYLKLMPGKTMHRDVAPRHHKGVLICGNIPLHLYCEDWATQLSFYAWSLGESVGSDYILTIDQILSDSQKNTSRVAKHYSLCTDVWQNKLYDRLHRCWQAVQSGHVFLNLPYEENKARCEAIEAELASTPDATFNKMTAGKPQRQR